MSYPLQEPSGSLAAEPEEAVLVLKCCNGDRAALDELVRRHQHIVFAVALRMLGDRDEAQDIAQDVFVRAYRGLGTFRQKAKFSTWLVSITMNLCRNRRRWWARRKRVIVASLDAPIETDEGERQQEVADPSPSPASVAQSRERYRQLAGALQLLPEAEREILILRDIHGYSYEEMATIVSCRLGTVKSRLNRARLQLRSLLDGRL